MSLLPVHWELCNCQGGVGGRREGGRGEGGGGGGSCCAQHSVLAQNDFWNSQSYIYAKAISIYILSNIT